MYYKVQIINVFYKLNKRTYMKLIEIKFDVRRYNMNIIKKIRRWIRQTLIGKTYLEKLEERGFIHGKNFNMYNSSIDWSHTYLVECGDDVTLSHSTILAHDASCRIYTGKSKIGRVRIGSRVFVGYNSIILPNVEIGDDVIIGAGSVVTKDIPDNSIVAGNPAKIIGNTMEFKEKHIELLKSKPVFIMKGEERTETEKYSIKQKLSITFGYDD